MGNRQNTQQVHILWNGGFSSTYRILQLCKKNIEIIPHYIQTNSNRSQYELKSIRKITKIIQEHPNTKAKIQSPRICKSNEIQPHISINTSWNWLRLRTRIDRIYEHMANYIKYTGEETKIEIGLSCDPEHKAYKYIRMFAYGYIQGDEDMQYLIIDPQKGFKEFTEVFKYFRFPLPLLGMTKREILEGYKQLGFGHILPYVWFCHTPLKGTPCGRCTGCRQVINAHLDIKLPKITRTMNRFSNFGIYKLWFKTKKNLTYLPGF